MGVEHREIRRERRAKCVLCDTVGLPLYNGLVDALFQTPGSWDLKQCSNVRCGLIWLDPVPLKADLHLLYRKYFFSRHAEQQQRFARGIRAGCYVGYKACIFLPRVILGLQAARNRMRHLFLEDLPPGKLFDIGCGDGRFLHRMQSRGWSVAGVDPDADAVETARSRYGLSAHQGELPELKLDRDTFDAVTMNHVLEHVSEPVGLLKETHRILKPGGRLVVVTPNTKSMGHRCFGSCWVNLDPPRHLQLFTPNALQSCASLAGFRQIQFFSSAANADSFAGASYGVREFYRARSMNSAETSINLSRTFKSLSFQIHEHRELVRNPESGDEGVLVCQK